MRTRNTEIRLTRRLLAALKRRIREVEGSEDEEVIGYYHPYAQGLEHSRTRPVTHGDFATLCARSALVLVGDYHTLDQAQLTFLRLLLTLESKGVRPTIALEMVEARHQKHVERYLKGKLDDREFLDEIEYFTHWGFDFTHYKPIFDHAKRLHLPIYGLNKGGSLPERDHFMANRLAGLVDGERAGPLLVLVGDLHLATPHLPAELATLGLEVPCPVLFQNSETVFMRKLAAGEEPFGWWSLGQKRFLNNNTPPTVKLMTYSNWLEHGGEALQMLYGYRGRASRDADEGADLAETVRGYVRALKSLFDLHKKTDDDFQVYMYKDLSFLQDSFFQRGPGRFYKAIILDGRAVYIDRDRTIYLPMLDVNRTVQETMHYLMRADLPLSRSWNGFTGRIHYFASGYLASKFINPMRHSPDLDQMERDAAGYPGLKTAKERLKLGRQLAVYRGVLQFFRFVHGRKRVVQIKAEPLLALDQKTAFALTEQIGKTIGEDLYRQYDAGRLSAVDLKVYIFTQRNPLLYNHHESGHLKKSPW